jgi:hypothetical protein
VLASLQTRKNYCNATRDRARFFISDFSVRCCNKKQQPLYPVFSFVHRRLLLTNSMTLPPLAAATELQDVAIEQQFTVTIPPEKDGIFLHQSPTATPNNTTMGQTIAGIAGNVLEWYDFAIFGYLGDVISVRIVVVFRARSIY